MNETFWDAQNLEIEACANFDDFPDPEKIAVPEKMLWIGCSGLMGGTPKSQEGGLSGSPGSPLVFDGEVPPHKKSRSPCMGSPPHKKSQGYFGGPPPQKSRAAFSLILGPPPKKIRAAYSVNIGPTPKKSRRGPTVSPRPGALLCPPVPGPAVSPRPGAPVWPPRHARTPRGVHS